MTTADRLYNHINQDVITCSLAPGAPFSESELCKRNRASLITIVPFRGYFVAPLTFGEFQNLQEVQLLTEPAIAALAVARATAQQPKSIETAGKYEYRVEQKNSYFTFLQRNFELHVGIAEASQNENLVEVTASIQTRLMRFFYLIIAMDAHEPALVAEHEKIVTAIRARKPELARERAAEHLRNTIERGGRLLVNAAQGRTGEGAFKLELGRGGLAGSPLLDKARRRVARASEARFYSDRLYSHRLYSDRH